MGGAIELSLVLRSLAGLLLALLPIRVTTRDGDRVEGTYAGVESSELVLESEGETTRFGFDQIVSMVPQRVAAKTGPSIRVDLRTGSRIAAEKVRLEQERLVIEPRRQNALELPLEAVRSIRFHSASAATDAQWLGMLEADGRGDLLAVRRDEDQLDQIRGLVEGIGEGVVQVTIGGDSVEAPIARLEGIVFAGDNQPAAGADIRLEDVYGSRWAAIAMLPSKADEPLRFRLSEEVTHEVPLDQIESIRFRGGVVRLATQQPAEQAYEAFLATNVDRSLMQTWFGPRRDGESDLILHAGASVEYRIPDGFRTLTGTVHRAESVARGGTVTVTISADGETIWSEAITDDTARGFELPVDQAARVRISVAGGDDGDLGDTIRISRPRLLK